jgi:adenine specific DNA methylase Mod
MKNNQTIYWATNQKSWWVNFQHSKDSDWMGTETWFGRSQRILDQYDATLVCDSNGNYGIQFNSEELMTLFFLRYC